MNHLGHQGMCTPNWEALEPEDGWRGRRKTGQVVTLLCSWPRAELQSPSWDGPVLANGKRGRAHRLDSAHPLCSQKYLDVKGSPYS